MSKLSFDVFKLYGSATKSFFMKKFTELDTKVSEVLNPETVTATGADYAVCVKWADENPLSKDRTGYFVQVAIGTGDGTEVEIANSKSYITGVTTNSAAFVENYTENSVNNPIYTLVGILGLVDVIDNGTCTVGAKCMPADDGTAIPSENSTGYHIVSRTDATHIKIVMAINTDMIQRIRMNTLGKNLLFTDNINLEIDNILADPSNHESVSDIVYDHESRLRTVEKILELQGYEL